MFLSVVLVPTHPRSTKTDKVIHGKGSRLETVICCFSHQRSGCWKREGIHVHCGDGGRRTWTCQCQVVKRLRICPGKEGPKLFNKTFVAEAQIIPSLACFWSTSACAVGLSMRPSPRAWKQHQRNHSSGCYSETTARFVGSTWTANKTENLIWQNWDHNLETSYQNIQRLTQFRLQQHWPLRRFFSWEN